MTLLINHLSTLKNPMGEPVATQWEHDIISSYSKSGTPIDYTALHQIAEINKDYEHWLGSLPGSIPSHEYAELAAHSARTDMEDEMFYLEGQQFFNANDLHPYKDFTDFLLVQENYPAPSSQHQLNPPSPPFDLHYTETSAGLSCWNNLLPQHIARSLVLSAAGPNGRHLSWITERAGVAWIWLDYDTANFQIWGAKHNLPYAIHLLEEHVRHIYTKRFAVVPLFLEHPDISPEQYLHMDKFETKPFRFQEPAVETLLANKPYEGTLDTIKKMIIGHHGCHLKWISKSSRVSQIYLDQESNSIMIVGSPDNITHATQLVRDHVNVIIDKLIT